MKKKGTLLLFPNLLGEHKHHEIFLPASVDRAMSTVDGLIAESEKGGRRFLSRFETKQPTHQVPIAILNKHTNESDLSFLLEPVVSGERWGLVSDAGLPCCADPGSLLVELARKKGVTVQAFVGPSALFLSLMLSGLPGQKFSFHGYLPKDSMKAEKAIQKMEKDSYLEQSTQVFIEAPHHNQKMLEWLLGVLSDETKLCIAWDLTLPTQKVLTQTVGIWKKSPLPNIHKKPTTFLFYSEEIKKHSLS